MWINVTVREHCDQGWNVRVHAPFRCIGASFVHNYITSYAWSFFILYFSTNRVRLKEFSSQRLYSLQPCAWFSHGSFSICVFVLREWYWSQSTSHETFLLYDVDHGMNIFLSLLLFLSSLFFFTSDVSTAVYECQDIIYLRDKERKDPFFLLRLR